MQLDEGLDQSLQGPTPTVRGKRSRSSMGFPDQMIRAFGGRGAVSLRDHSVTGIQWLQFTPVEQQHFRFDLALSELESGCEILDDVDELWDYVSRTGTGHHPLGLNFGGDVAVGSFDHLRPARALILQESSWAPNLFERTGTFHKYIEDQLVSFSLRSQVMCDPDRDAIRYRVAVRNRGASVLRLGFHPRPRVVDPLVVSYPRKDVSQHPSWLEMVFDQSIEGAPAGGSKGGRFSVVVESSLFAAEGRWELELDPGEENAFELVLHILPNSSHTAELPATVGESDWETASSAYRARRAQFLNGLPTLESDDQRIVDFYNACASTLIESTWRRDEFVLNPFYSAGTWLFALAWDISFSVKALALTDPLSVQRTLVELVRCGLGEHSYIGWDGSLGHHYSFSLIAGIQALRDYIAVTGDVGVLHSRLGATEETVGARLARDLGTAHRERLREDGLLSYGPNSNYFLENRTDGYQGATAAINILLTDAVRWVDGHGWPSLTDEQLGCLMEASERLWDSDARWYSTAITPVTHELVKTYHLYELLWSDALPLGRKLELAGHLVRGEFIGAHGMYSIARSDTLHWDYDDADWGGGGQYTGMPLRIAEGLWRMGSDEKAWDVLEACLSWTGAFPYFPQEIMADSLTTLDVEQPAEIAVGAGVQAIIFGLFGILPESEGTLVVRPRRPPIAGRLCLRGYRHRDHLVTVELDADGWTVRCAEWMRTGSYGEHCMLKLAEMNCSH